MATKSKKPVSYGIYIADRDPQEFKMAVTDILRLMEAERGDDCIIEALRVLGGLTQAKDVCVSDCSITMK